MKSEPAAHRVIGIVHLAWANQTIIPRLALQFPLAGMPVCPGIGEVTCVNQRRIGVGSEQQWCILGRQPGSEGDGLPRLDDPSRSPLEERDSSHDKRPSLRLCLDKQNPLGLPNLSKQPRTAGMQPVARNGDTAPPHGRVSGSEVRRSMALTIQPAPAASARTADEPGLTSCSDIRSRRVCAADTLAVSPLGAAECYIP
jgi:hypothetical protein